MYCWSLSDMWRAYGGIAAMGYQHLTVNHQMNFVDPQTGAHTQNIERSWKAAKERNKRTAQFWILMRVDVEKTTPQHGLIRPNFIGYRSLLASTITLHSIAIQ